MADPKLKKPGNFRQPKPKKFNLSVPPSLRMPHEDIIRPLVTPVVRETADSEPVGGRENYPDTPDNLNVGSKQSPLSGVNISLLDTPDKSSVGSIQAKTSGVSTEQRLTPDTQIVWSKDQNLSGVEQQASGVNTPDENQPSGVTTPDKSHVGCTDRRSKYEARRAKAEQKVNFFLPTAKHNENKQFAASLGLTLTELYPFAVDHLKECREYRDQQMSGVNTPHDDLKIWKTTDDIIMRYRALTDNKWKPGDDQEARRFNDTDPRLIEIGLLNTQLNAKGKKINSFAYFIPEIEEMLAIKLDDQTIEIMLKRRREQWAKAKKERAGK